MKGNKVKKKRVWHCKRCGHEWMNRRVRGEYKKPTICARCKSPYWDRERAGSLSHKPSAIQTSNHPDSEASRQQDAGMGKKRGTNPGKCGYSKSTQLRGHRESDQREETQTDTD